MPESSGKCCERNAMEVHSVNVRVFGARLLGFRGECAVWCHYSDFGFETAPLKPEENAGAAHEEAWTEAGFVDEEDIIVAR